MSNVVKRAMGHMMAGLRHLSDNPTVFWLGATWGVASVYIEHSRFAWVPLAVLAGVLVVVFGLRVWLWWERHRRRTVALSQGGERRCSFRARVGRFARSSCSGSTVIGTSGGRSTG